MGLFPTPLPRSGAVYLQRLVTYKRERRDGTSETLSRRGTGSGTENNPQQEDRLGLFSKDLRSALR